MFLRGTALTPPLFLPALLVAAAVGARRDGLTARRSAGLTSLIATAFLAGSTLNLPNDFTAARSAGTPTRLTAALAAVHVALSLTLLYNALPTLLGRASGGSSTATVAP